MQLVNSISYTTSGPASSEVAVSLGPGQTVLRGWGGVVVGLEKRGGGSSVFETLVRGGGVVQFSATHRGNSFHFQRTKAF